LKQWDELASCFAPMRRELRRRPLPLLGSRSDHPLPPRVARAESGSTTIHHGHHPEIEITGETTARGSWALYNYMFNDRQKRGIRIGAYYGTSS